MRKLIITLVAILGFILGATYATHAQNPDRFFRSDEVNSGYDRIYLLHDRKMNEVCFIVVEPLRGGAAMIPRVC